MKTRRFPIPPNQRHADRKNDYKRPQGVRPVLEEPEESTFCFACPSGEAHLLGVLGRMAHYRCRDCGMDSSKMLQFVTDSDAGSL